MMRRRKVNQETIKEVWCKMDRVFPTILAKKQENEMEIDRINQPLEPSITTLHNHVVKGNNHNLEGNNYYNVPITLPTMLATTSTSSQRACLNSCGKVF